MAFCGVCCCWWYVRRGNNKSGLAAASAVLPGYTCQGSMRAALPGVVRRLDRPRVTFSRCGARCLRSAVPSVQVASVLPFMRSAGDVLRASVPCWRAGVLRVVRSAGPASVPVSPRSMRPRPRASRVNGPGRREMARTGKFCGKSPRKMSSDSQETSCRRSDPENRQNSPYAREREDPEKNRLEKASGRNGNLPPKIGSGKVLKFPHAREKGKLRKEAKLFLPTEPHLLLVAAELTRFPFLYISGQQMRKIRRKRDQNAKSWQFCGKTVAITLRLIWAKMKG